MSANDSPQEITKRWLWRLGLLFLFSVIGLVILLVVWRCNLATRSERALAAIQAAGHPVTLLELEQKYYPLLSSNENGAVFYEKVFSLLRVTNSRSWKAISYVPMYQSPDYKEFFSDTRMDLINQMLLSNRACLELLRQIPVATNCRFPIDLKRGFDVTIPHVSRLRECSWILELESAVKARNQDAGGCVACMQATLRLSHSLDREPVSVSQQVRCVLVNRASRMLERALNSLPFSGVQLSGLSEAFQSCRVANAAELITANQFCEDEAFFNMSYAQLQKVGSQTDSVDAAIPPEVHETVWRSMRLAGFQVREHAVFLEIAERQFLLNALPSAKRLDAEEELQKWLERRNGPPRLGGMSALFLYGTRRVLGDECVMEAHIGIVQTVLAVERYRLANQNRLPEKLSNLAPTFLDSVPMDPFDGKPIRYKKLSKGYMVYSIGEDRKDDGGVFAPQAKPGAPSDITFVVER